MRAAPFAPPHPERTPCSARPLPTSTVQQEPTIHLLPVGLPRSAQIYPPNLFRHHGLDKVQRLKASEVDRASIHPPSQSLRCESKRLLPPGYLTAAALNPARCRLSRRDALGSPQRRVTAG